MTHSKPALGRDCWGLRDGRGGEKAGIRKKSRTSRMHGYHKLSSTCCDECDI